METKRAILRVTQAHACDGIGKVCPMTSDDVTAQSEAAAQSIAESEALLCVRCADHEMSAVIQIDNCPFCGSLREEDERSPSLQP